MKQLTKGLTNWQQRSQQLYEAVEKGLLPMDSTLTERANNIHAQRQALLTEITGLRRLKQMPVEALGEKIIQALTVELRERRRGKDRVFRKKDLKLLVEEILYQNRQLVIKGSYAAVAHVAGAGNAGTPQGDSARV